MPSRAERPAGVMMGDIAAGDGYVGIVADLPGGAVGIALFGDSGQPRRIVYIDSEECQLVKRSWEWQSLPDRSQDIAQTAYARQNRQSERER